MNHSMRAKDANYHLGLRYPVVVRELAPEEGGGYVASIPQLGSGTFVATGETAGEALEALDALRRRLIPILLADGVELPEPDYRYERLETRSDTVALRTGGR